MTEKKGQTRLVADNESERADLYATWLRRDHEVRTAYGGAEAMEKLDRSVDIVFLDRRMPRVTGDGVLSEIWGEGMDCRVMLMTAVDPDFESTDIDFHEYLTKPVMREDIEGVLNRLETLAAEVNHTGETSASPARSRTGSAIFLPSSAISTRTMAGVRFTPRC